MLEASELVKAIEDAPINGAGGLNGGLPSCRLGAKHGEHHFAFHTTSRRAPTTWVCRRRAAVDVPNPFRCLSMSTHTTLHPRPTSVEIRMFQSKDDEGPPSAATVPIHPVSTKGGASLDTSRPMTVGRHTTAFHRTGHHSRRVPLKTVGKHGQHKRTANRWGCDDW